MAACEQRGIRRAVVACVVAVSGLAGCAHQAVPPQTIEVRVDADAPAWAGPLACRASNAAGSWPFTAPGAVTVVPSTSPLQIACEVPDGAVAEPSVTSAVAAAAADRAREGAATGAKVGAGAGVVLGVAAAPLMGGPFALLIAAGAVAKGGQIGGIVGALRGGPQSRYPSPVVLHIKAEPAARTSP